MKTASANARLLQWIDAVAGVPVCCALTGWRLVRELVARPDPGHLRSILFVKLAEQGSTVLAHAAIRAAAERVGRDNVYFLVFEENRFILDVLGLIPEQNVFCIRTKNFLAMAASALGRLREIRARGIGACIDLDFFARSTAIVSYLSGAPRRVGLHAYYGEGPFRGDLMTHRPRYNPHLHTSQLFLALVKALDEEPRRFPTWDYAVAAAERELPQFEPRPEEEAEVAAIVREVCKTGAVPPLVLLNANAGDLMPLRRWAPDNYVALARRLLAEDPGVHVGFTGAPDEAGAIRPLVAAVDSPRCVLFAGRTTLRQLLVLYGMARLLVTNDSGPAHFAALTPVRTVVLFGPETPALFGALTPRAHHVAVGLACSPCVSAQNNRRSACRDNRCMQRLGVGAVMDAVREALAAAAPAASPPAAPKKNSDG